MKNGLTQLACLSTLMEHMNIKPDGLDVISGVECLADIRLVINNHINKRNQEILTKEPE